MVKRINKTSDIKSANLIEAQIVINPRGRSVMNGTLAFDGVMETFKHEINERLKAQFIELILSASIHS